MGSGAGRPSAKCDDAQSGPPEKRKMVLGSYWRSTMSMTAAMNKKYGKMSGGEKAFFFCALVVFLFTAGFAFPNLLLSDQ